MEGLNSYYGFPPEYYEVQYPNKGSPELASKVIDLLRKEGIEAEGVKRGLDHGVYAGFSVGECAPIFHISPLIDAVIGEL
jgi:aromatic ring-opening dioxygenase catalytic subunit (LigB family)